jgi:hypothetical protein
LQTKIFVKLGLNMHPEQPTGVGGVRMSTHKSSTIIPTQRCILYQVNRTICCQNLHKEWPYNLYETHKTAFALMKGFTDELDRYNDIKLAK